MPTEPDLPSLLALAERAARIGGRVVLEGAGAASAEHKGAGDYVTEVDRASEGAIREILSRATPGIPVVGEEAGGAPGNRWWVVDPLDGTTNFLHRFRRWASRSPWSTADDPSWASCTRRSSARPISARAARARG